ncbi:MAG TPA: LLM class F420-dependent oxidoreductase [Sphingobium sp.]|uniref:LLM class F420-dependent oxidoreductase n=1 Tax=Sphingobium sp. TaxID=1912891 RepID=UPI002ED5BBDB
MSFIVNVGLPFDQLDPVGEFVSMAAIREISRVAEEAGFCGGSVTDHPAPSNNWLENGGHHAQDPFALLGMVAAATDKLRLQTGILVLPYRNPFITARAVATLDVFSGGRVTLGVGAGYMKKEYAALGVDFETRNGLMDEFILAMKAAWTGDEFSFVGGGYNANGIRINPAPMQRPHPPLFIGGNAKRAIRRAVDLGDAWYPFLSAETVTKTARTVNLSGEDELRRSLDYFHDYAAASDRAKPPIVVCSGLFSIQPGWSTQEAQDRIGKYRELGFAGGDVGIVATQRSEWCDQARKFGEEVLSKLG